MAKLGEGVHGGEEANMIIEIIITFLILAAMVCGALLLVVGFVYLVTNCHPVIVVALILLMFSIALYFIGVTDIMLKGWT